MEKARQSTTWDETAEVERDHQAMQRMMPSFLVRATESVGLGFWRRLIWGNISQIFRQAEFEVVWITLVKIHIRNRYLYKVKKRHCSWSWAFDKQALFLTTVLHSSYILDQHCRHMDLLAVPQALHALFLWNLAYADPTFRNTLPSSAHTLPANSLLVLQDLA